MLYFVVIIRQNLNGKQNEHSPSFNLFSNSENAHQGVGKGTQIPKLFKFNPKKLGLGLNLKSFGNGTGISWYCDASATSASTSQLAKSRQTDEVNFLKKILLLQSD